MPAYYKGHFGHVEINHAIFKKGIRPMYIFVRF